VFRGKAGCTGCHVGPTFTDELFHNTGVAWRDGAFADSGQYLVTGERGDLGAFTTPTLREVARTAPYMHDGTIATLAEVIESYDRGGNPNPYLDNELRPLRLTAAEKSALGFSRVAEWTDPRRNACEVDPRNGSRDLAQQSLRRCGLDWGPPVIP
jgi:cytochrome c peroxidase